MKRDLLCAVLLFLLIPAAHAQSDSPQEQPDVWAGAAMALDVETGSGEGWDWIRKHARDSQFVLFGEQHGITGIPQVAAVAYANLQDTGYHHLALEVSPWLGEHMSVHGVSETLEEYPYELAFSYDEVVSLLVRADTLSQDDLMTFWGLDQPVTAIHGYKRLSEILPTSKARQMARGLHLKAALQAGRYIGSNHREDLKRLRMAAGAELSPEADLIISSIEKSMEIYLAYFAGQKGEGPRGLSDGLREPYMKQNLDAKLAEAADTTGGIPRAVILMGGAHIMEGIGPNGVRTLGDHAQALAEANGLDALHISIHSHREDLANSPPASIFTSSDAVLVDLRKIRNATTSEWREKLSPSLRRTVEQYDAAIYLRGALAQADGKSVMSAREQRFRQQLISTLGIAGGCALILLSLLWLPLRATVHALRPNLSLSFLSPTLPWLGIAGAGLLAVGIFVIQVMRLLTPASENAILSSGNLIGTILMIVAMVKLGSLFFAWRHSWWGAVSRIHYTVLVLALVVLIWFMNGWNVGGMMG